MPNKEIDTVSVTYKTTNYKQFKTLDGNRNIFDPQVTRLIKAIEKKNLLHQNPILVNSQMEIIDGQHRLLAAQALGLPIYYRIEDKATLEDTIILNANNRKWVAQDYLDSYVKLGRPQYIKVQEFKDEYKISTHIAMRLLGGVQNTKTNQAFKDGTFEIVDQDRADRIASIAVEMRGLNRDGAWSDRDFLVAVNRVMDQIDPKIIIDKMKQYNLFLTRRVSIKEYVVQLEEILNYENGGKTVELQ